MADNGFANPIPCTLNTPNRDNVNLPVSLADSIRAVTLPMMLLMILFRKSEPLTEL